MRFSEKFNIKLDGSEEWFDLLLNQDTPLYVDPFLIFEDKDPFWAEAKEEIVNFFEHAVGLAIKSEGQQNQYWKSAVQILKCPEPNQFCLGLSTGDPKGSGLGKIAAESICKSISKASKSEIVDFSMIVGFMILVPNIGVDVLSDCVCNILKKKFIEYTQNVCREESIEMEEHVVSHAGFNKISKRWDKLKFYLPSNPYSNSYSLLVPKRFLAEIPSEEAGYDYYDAIDMNDELRNRFNLELNKELNKSKRLAIIKAAMLENPEKSMDFIKKFNAMNPRNPYDISTDPEGIFTWYEKGIELAQKAELVREPLDKNIKEFVLALANRFKHAVEEQGGWKLLWNDGNTNHRKEDIVQSLAGMMWRSQCRNANIDINREIETGRGPVDFKFSSGWEARALLEVKHLDSSAFLKGLQKQTLQYLKSEEVYVGVYLVIQYEESKRMDERIIEIQSEIELLKRQGKNIEVVFVNASPDKPSASKL